MQTAKTAKKITKKALWNTVEFDGFSQMLSACNSLATFQLVDTFAKKPGTKTVMNPTRFIGVWNDGLEKTVAIVTEDYNLVQSKDLFLEATNIVRSTEKLAKGTVRGYTRESPTKAILTFWLSTHYLTFEDQITIELGLRFINSVDKSRSLEGSFFGLQKTCSNGMVLKKTVGKTIRQIHSGKFDPKSIVREMIANLTAVDNLLRNVIEQAISDMILKDDVTRILINLGVAKKYHDDILTHVNETKISRWNLYAELTDFVTNRYTEIGTGTLSGKLRLENRIEDLLCTSSEELIQRTG
jgi:hypothetical protein